MSCNLGTKKCARCLDDEVILLTCPVPALTYAFENRSLSLERLAERFPDMVAPHLFAQAKCLTCGAQYIAWVTPACKDHDGTEEFEWSAEIGDLSYRSTFNDEPGEWDLPEWDGKNKARLCEDLLRAAKHSAYLGSYPTHYSVVRLKAAVSELKRYEETS